MSPRTYGYIFSALIVVGSALQTSAQEEELVVDTTARRFIPTGIRFGPDLISLGTTYLRTDFTGWEVAADIDFYRFYLITEFGNWSVNKLIDNGVYTNDGSYFRIGVDVNFLLKDPDRNMFFLGGRVGRSSFTDAATYSYDVAEFDPGIITVSNPHVIATWVEMTTGLRVKIWKPIWLGATARFKFGLDLDGNVDLTSYNVPGYGTNFKPSWWGFSYYLLFKIPFRAER